jgi:hypothetical protein
MLVSNGGCVRETSMEKLADLKPAKVDGTMSRNLLPDDRRRNRGASLQRELPGAAGTDPARVRRKIKHGHDQSWTCDVFFRREATTSAPRWPDANRKSQTRSAISSTR